MSISHNQSTPVISDHALPGLGPQQDRPLADPPLGVSKELSVTVKETLGESESGVIPSSQR